MIRLLFCVLTASLLLSAQPKVAVDLHLDDITKPLQNLSAADQAVVNDAIRALNRNEHLAALAVLSKLSASNPMNTSLRVLRAYVLLEVGNVAGALTEARTAESTGSHSAYRCWFLAQVASAAGNKQLCRREVRHLAGSSYEAEARKLPVLNKSN